MQGTGTSREAWEECETTVRQYLAQGHYTGALRVVMQHYQDAIVSYCRCHLLDQDLAQEVAQEIFLTAFERMPGFRGHSSLKTWLYGIAWKKCGKVRRTRQRRATVPPRPPGHDSRPGTLRPARPPEDVVSQEGCRRRVWDALQRLRVYERELPRRGIWRTSRMTRWPVSCTVSRRTIERHLPRAEARFCHAYERCHTHARTARHITRDAPAYPGLIALVPDVRPS